MDEDVELKAIRERLARDLAAPPAGPVVATEADLPRLLGQGVVLLDCWATWCGPCRAMEPLVDALAREFAGKVTVAKLDVDEEPRVAQALGVQGVPTFFVFKDGRPVERFVGVVPKAQLAMALRKWSGPTRAPGPRR